MTLTGIQLSSGVVVGAQKPLDARYGPFANVADANSSLAAGLRYIGLTVGILQNNEVIEYWYIGGITDVCLLIKKTAPNLSGVSLDAGTY